MAVTTVELIRWILVLIGFIFLCSMTFFIAVMKLKRKSQMYQSTFYTLYLMISFPDTLTFFVNIYAGKAKLIDEFKPFYYANPTIGGINWLLSGYCIFLQSLLHVCIAINRIWVAYELVIQRKSIARLGRRLLWVVFIIPIIILSPRFSGTMISFISSDGSMGVRYAQPHLAVYHAVAGPCVVISTSLLSLVLTIATIRRYRRLFKNHKIVFASTKTDILFGQAALAFCFQLTVAAYYVMLNVANATASANLQAFALWYYQYIIDAVSLFNPIALICVCSFVRQDYCNFYFGSKTRTPVISINSVSNNL